MPRVEQACSPEMAYEPTEPHAAAAALPATSSSPAAREAEHWRMIRQGATADRRRRIVRGWRRGLTDQAPRREHQRQVRSRVVDVASRCRQQGWSARETAAALGVAQRTLRDWQSRAGGEGLQAKPRGRHPYRSSREVRQEVLKVLDQSRPSTGLPTLRPLLPKVPAAELARLAKRFRRVRRLRYGGGYRLTWHRVGAVWAMDFVLPSGPVDDRFRCVFSLDDLASRFQLQWNPKQSETAQVVLEALHTLFVCYGPPLVLKSDNGPAFLAQLTATLLAQWNVVPLFSPPGQPWYNGTCERANGILSVGTAEEAAREGHPDYWTSEDLDWARQWNNQVRRPVPLQGAAPAELWNARLPISDEERNTFLRTVESYRLAERARRGHAPHEALDHWACSAIDRAAVRDALGACGYLTITPARSRIATPSHVPTPQPTPPTPVTPAPIVPVPPHVPARLPAPPRPAPCPTPSLAVPPATPRADLPRALAQPPRPASDPPRTPSRGQEILTPPLASAPPSCRLQESRPSPLLQTVPL